MMIGSPLQILGQCGSFVPCDKAVLSIRDRIHSRLNSSDDMETNMSTYKMEMKDTGKGRATYHCQSRTDFIV